MPETCAKPRILIILILLYSVLLIYASLMPFTFANQVNLKQIATYNFWSYWPFNPSGSISGSDVVSNLILYLPLGFLLATQAILRWTNSTKTAIIVAAVICASLSLSIEILQAFTISRVSSASDVLLNSISGLGGAVIGAIGGQKYFKVVTTWIRRRWQVWPLDIFTIIILLLLVADTLSPFMPTINLAQVWHSLKRSHFNLIIGFAQHPWHWWLVLKVLTFHTLALMLAFWKDAEQSQLRWLKSAVLATLFALCLELTKPMIATRDINLANLVASSLGAFLILITGPLIITSMTKQKILNLAIGLLVIYLLYLGWTPFNFHWNLQLAAHKLPTNYSELLPLYAYAMGATLEHARLFVQNITLAGVLVYLLRFRYSGFDIIKGKLWLALTIGLVLGLLQEGGQFFLISRTPSMTDIYCFMLGAYLGTKLPKNDKVCHDG